MRGRLPPGARSAAAAPDVATPGLRAAVLSMMVNGALAIAEMVTRALGQSYAWIVGRVEERQRIPSALQKRITFELIYRKLYIYWHCGSNGQRPAVFG
jgi:hypothetical protein